MIYVKPGIFSVYLATEIIEGVPALTKVGVCADAWTLFYPFFHVTAAAYEADE